jgi:hypothetical protein
VLSSVLKLSYPHIILSNILRIISKSVFFLGISVYVWEGFEIYQGFG